MQDLAVKKTAEVIEAPQQNSPARLIELAINNNADVAQLEKLMELQERWDATQARKAFFHAITEFQAITPAIRKKKQGHNYQYAPLGDIAEQLRQPLQKCALSYRFEQEHSETLIKVTCVVTHVDGHSERTTMQGLPDTSGSKNAIQATGSTVSYLQRYTLIGALGITTADDDIDARLTASGGDLVSDEQIAEIESLLSEMKANREKFLGFFKITRPSDLPASQYARAIKMLEAKRK